MAFEKDVCFEMKASPATNFRHAQTTFKARQRRFSYHRPQSTTRKSEQYLSEVDVTLFRLVKEVECTQCEG